MASNGKIVVTDSGKRGVRTTGKTATFNTNGECEECCGVQECIYCKENTTPSQIVVTITGILPKSGCDTGYGFVYDEFSRCGKWVEAPSALSVATLRQAAPGSCEYVAFVDATAGKIALYNSPDDCASDVNRVVTATLQYYLVRTSGFPAASLDDKFQVEVLLGFDLEIYRGSIGNTPAWNVTERIGPLTKDVKPECMEEWAGDCVAQVDAWDAGSIAGYGGAVSAVSER